MPHPRTERDPPSTGQHRVLEECRETPPVHVFIQLQQYRETGLRENIVGSIERYMVKPDVSDIGGP